MKVTCTVQLFPGASGFMQVAPYALNALDEVVKTSPTKTVSVVLMLVTVTFNRASLWTISLPKLSEAGEKLSTGGCAMPVPVRLTVSTG